MSENFKSLNDDFRVFELIEDISVLDLDIGSKDLHKGYRFIGFYWDNKRYIGISNMSNFIKANSVKELYKIRFEEVPGESDL